MILKSVDKRGDKMRILKIILSLFIISFIVWTGAMVDLSGEGSIIEVHRDAYSASVSSTIANQAYDTRGNGGRKLVRLNNGWLVALLVNGTKDVKYYKSIDNGNTWILMGSLNANGTNSCIVSFESKVYTVIASGTSVTCHAFDALDANGLEITSLLSYKASTIAIAQNEIGSGVSAAADSKGFLHVTWCSKNSTHPNNFNIYYRKSINGGVAWEPAKQVTHDTTNSYNNSNPSIVICSNGFPAIIFQSYRTSGYEYIYCFYNDGASWKTSTVYCNKEYAQCSPCAVVSPDGDIHVVWQGRVEAYMVITDIQYSKSTDGGATWSSNTKLTNDYQYSHYNASISSDSNNNLYVIFQGRSSGSYDKIRKIVYDGSWGSITDMTSANSSDPSICSNYTDFIDPVFIYKDSQTASIKFLGNLGQPADVSIVYPTQNLIFTDGDIIKPIINVSEQNNNNIICKYYLDNETLPRDVKIISDTLSTQPVKFNKIDANTLLDGKHTIRFEVDNGASLYTNTVSFIIEHKPVIGKVNIISTDNSIAITGSSYDGGTGLSSDPYSFTIGENTSGWVPANVSSLNSAVSPKWSTSGSGRKLVRLTNGWIVSSILDATAETKTIYYYLSKDNGATWECLCFSSHGTASNVSWAITSKGTKVYTIICKDSSVLFQPGIDVTTQKNVDINSETLPLDSGQTSTKGCSIEVSADGIIHAAWSTKNSTYSTFYNIRYSKSIDDGISWDPIAQVTTYGEYIFPSIVIRNENPIIIYEGQYYNIGCLRWNGSSWVSNDICYTSSFYQNKPSAIVTSDGNIHVVWHGTDSTEKNTYNIRYSKSTDGGATWSTVTKLTSGKSYDQMNPTITADRENNLYVLFDGETNAGEMQIKMMIYKDGSWGEVKDLTSNVGTMFRYPSTCINFTDFISPLCIYQDDQTGTVRFVGTFSGDTTYTATNLESAKMYPVIFEAKDNTGYTSTYYVEACTKAAIPILSSGQITDSTIVIKSNDTNSDEAQYLISCGNKYVSQTGSLIDVPVWIDLVNKQILVAGLQPNTTYIFTAKARNGELIETEVNQQLNVMTLSNPPLVPKDVNIISISSNSIKISWEAVPEATGYDVEETVGGVVTVVASNTPLNEITLQNSTPYTEYSYQVRSVNSEGTSEWSRIVSSRTLIGVPQNIIVTPQATSANIAWSSVIGAQQYDVEVDGTFITTVNQTSFKIKDLKPLTQHTFRIRAKNVMGSGDWSPLQIVLTTDGVPKIAPSFDLNDKNDVMYTHNTIILNWDPIPDAENYEVSEVIAGVQGLPIYCGPNTTFEVRGLEPGSTYTYQVCAINSVHKGPWSSDITITTKKLDTPSNISYIESDDQITITWDAVQGAENYDVCFGEEIISSITAISGSKTVNFTKIGLTANTKYLVKVKANMTGGESAWSDEIPVFTLPTKLSAPKVYAVVTDTSVTLSWSPVDGAVGYNINIDGVILENDNISRTFTYDELELYSLHTYQVCARSASIEGHWSEVQNIRTLPGKPKAPGGIVVKSSQTGTTISWDAEQGATGYDIEVFDGATTAEIYNISRNSYTHRQIAQYAECKYRLRTRNTQGISKWSGYIINNALRKNCIKKNSMTLNVGVTDITDFTPYTMIVTYNPDVLVVTDLCTITGKNEIEAGEIEGTGIIIREFSPGRIVFVVDRVMTHGEAWTGVINSIKFMARVTGGTTVSYTVLCK